MNDFLKMIQCSEEYAAIKAFYGERRAERSQVPLINHINEGIAIIGALKCQLPSGGSFSVRQAARAYCLHPLFQNDDEMLNEGIGYARMPTAFALEVMLAMEYRWRANNWLSDKVKWQDACLDPDMRPQVTLDGRPNAGPIPEVRAMLIADKVQNYKDFIAHHQATHARSKELTHYFQIWLDHLGVDDSLMFRLCNAANDANQG